jgi:tetratricopeptide (TPR) repeat protein
MMSKFNVLSPLNIVALAACILLTACTNTGPKSLQEGFNKYTAQQAGESETIADQYIAANPNSPDLDQAYYLRGISRMTRGNRVGAAADLRLAISKTTRADVRNKSHRTLGDIAYDQQQWAEAIKSYQSALDNPPLPPVTATYLNYRIGAALQCQGEWTRAVAWFAKVVAAANDPALTDRAVRRMHATSFSLQYGAYQDPAGARVLQARLQAAGIAATIPSEIRTGNKLWYLVQSGFYANWPEATAARDRVLAKFPVAVIVP